MGLKVQFYMGDHMSGMNNTLKRKEKKRKEKKRKDEERPFIGWALVKDEQEGCRVID